ncbi:hypothetical protein C3L33_05912, partial [Rhododendron williamsianum]
MIPFSEARENQIAALRAMDFMFMDPLTTGDYPLTMRTLVGTRLPNFSKEQSQMLKGSIDFLGLNYYTAKYVEHAAPNSNNANPSYNTDYQVSLTTQKDGVPIGPKGASDWLFDYPRGIYDTLLYIKKNYNNPLIYITENGIDEVNNETLSLEEALEDNKRVDYFCGHLSFLLRAIKDGANVKGYFAWSLLDNFEWGLGYTSRFGINYVDFNDGLKRYPKLSARWFKDFLKQESLFIVSHTR